jgi:hypothetical protein
VVLVKTSIWQTHGEVLSVEYSAKELARKQVRLFTTCTMLARVTYHAVAGI